MQIDNSLIEERLSEEVIRQLNVYSETLQDFSELGFIKRLKKHYREIVSTQNSLAVESLTEQLKPKQSLKAAAVNIGSLAVGGMVADLITSISPGGGAAETVLGLSAGFLAYFNTQRIARRNDSDLREREDIKRQIKYLNNERLLGATQLKAAARAGRYVLESGNFCALNFKQVETPLAEAA